MKFHEIPLDPFFIPFPWNPPNRPKGGTVKSGARLHWRGNLQQSSEAYTACTLHGGNSLGIGMAMDGPQVMAMLV